MAYTITQLRELVDNWVKGDDQQKKDELYFCILSNRLTQCISHDSRRTHKEVLTDQLTAMEMPPNDDDATTRKNLLTQLIYTSHGHSAGSIRQDLPQDDPYYLCQLGYLHELGICGKAMDSARAIQYYEDAIAKDNVVAMIRRAGLYERGIGGPVNKAAALCLLLEAYTRANATVCAGILPTIKTLMTSAQDLETALHHYPHTELCFEDIPLTQDMERALLAGVLSNEKITSLKPTQLFMTATNAVQQLFLHVRDKLRQNTESQQGASTTHLSRHNWLNTEFDTLYQGWLMRNPTLSGKLFYLLRQKQISSMHIQQCERAAEQAFEAGSPNPRLTLLSLIANVDKPVDERTLNYLDEQATLGDTDAMTLRAIYHLNDAAYDKAATLLKKAADKGNQYASYLLAVRIYNTATHGNSHKKSPAAYLQFVDSLLASNQFFAEATSVFTAQLATHMSTVTHTDLIQLFDNFTGPTLQLAEKKTYSNYYGRDHYDHYGQYRDRQQELMSAILRNFAITEITPLALLDYHPEAEREQVRAHLQRNKEMRTNYQRAVAAIRENNNWDDCVGPNGTLTHDGTHKFSLFALAYHYGDQAFRLEAFSKMSPERLLTLAQHGADVPNEDRLIGFEPVAKRFGYLTGLRLRVNQETIFLQISNYLDKKSRERGAQARFQERLDNYAEILRYLSNNCEHSDIVKNFAAFVTFISSQQKVATSSSLFSTSKETYHHLRDMLTKVDARSLVARYQEHEQYLVTNRSQPFIQALLARMDNETPLGRAAAKAARAAGISSAEDKSLPIISLSAPEAAPTGLFSSFRSFWRGSPSAPSATTTTTSSSSSGSSTPAYSYPAVTAASAYARIALPPQDGLYPYSAMPPPYYAGPSTYEPPSAPPADGIDGQSPYTQFTPQK